MVYPLDFRKVSIFNLTSNEVYYEKQDSIDVSRRGFLKIHH